MPPNPAEPQLSNCPSKINCGSYLEEVIATKVTSQIEQRFAQFANRGRKQALKPFERIDAVDIEGRRLVVEQKSSLVTSPTRR
jgi:hypothetical protein